MTDRRDYTSIHGHDRPGLDRPMQRDQSLAGRDLLAIGRSAAGAGDAAAAIAAFTMAIGCGDPTVASEAAAAIAEVSATRPRNRKQGRT